jgi:DNA-binding SARP family transcriptional activator/tetratricopeptide (TPR) repeat protein
MEFRLLGPVELWTGAAPVELGPAKQRTVLAALLVDAGRVVPVEELADRVWGPALPAQPRRLLHAYVTKARAVLREALPAAVAVPLDRRADGYLLQAGAEQVDLHRFRGLADRARDLTDDAARAAALREALTLWRGAALTGLSGPWVERTRDDLERQRVAAVVAWAGLELRLGNPHAVLADLRELAGRYPLAEPVAAALMQALADTGRPADALALYSTMRRRRVDERGTEPGPRLRELQEAVLRGDRDAGALRTPATNGTAGTAAGTTAGTAGTAAGTAAASAGADPAPGPPPAQLPADIPGFTGRARELSELDGLLAGVAAAPAAPLSITAVSGPAGVGKTALAVRWAHEIRSRFPDGQVSVDLRGAGPGQPMTAGEALAALLAAFGVAGPDLPVDVAERAARWRAETSGRRILIVLDNAASVEQVRPLLPGAGGCLLVVTSRDPLTALAARPGAHRLALEPLPAADAVALLRVPAGGRVDAEPAAAAALAEDCGRLPLALWIAAELAASRPGVPLADLAADLAAGLTDHRRPALAAGGDAPGAVRPVFSWCYQQLAADMARAVRMLGRHPGPDCDAYALAALTGSGLDAAAGLLERLRRAHLVHPLGGPGLAARYGMHDLLRGYAAERAAADAGTDDQPAAVTRLFDYYLATAAAAVDLLHPAERSRRPPVAPSGGPVPPIADAGAARRWLDAELPALIVLCTRAAEHGQLGHARRLRATLYRYLDAGGHHEAALAVHTAGLDAARQAGDPVAEADALTHLGVVRWRLGQHEQAAADQRRASGLYHRTGQPLGEARALNGLGIAYQTLGRYEQAADHHLTALTLYQQLGDRLGQARALSNLGAAEQTLGRYDPAAGHLRQALTRYRQVGEPLGEASALTNLGLIETQRGRPDQAIDCFHQAIALFREGHQPAGEAKARTLLGEVYAGLGRYREAIDLHREALDLLRRIGDREAEVDALNSLGDAWRGAGRLVDAHDTYTAARAAAVRTGERHQQARADTGLGDTCRATGQGEQALRHWRRALDLYTELGSPEAAEILVRLEALETLETSQALETFETLET